MEIHLRRTLFSEPRSWEDIPTSQAMQRTLCKLPWSSNQKGALDEPRRPHLTRTYHREQWRKEMVQARQDTRRAHRKRHQESLPADLCQATQEKREQEQRRARTDWRIHAREWGRSACHKKAAIASCKKWDTAAIFSVFESVAVEDEAIRAWGKVPYNSYLQFLFLIPVITVCLHSISARATLPATAW